MQSLSASAPAGVTRHAAAQGLKTQRSSALVCGREGMQLVHPRRQGAELFALVELASEIEALKAQIAAVVGARARRRRHALVRDHLIHLNEVESTVEQGPALAGGVDCRQELSQAHRGLKSRAGQPWKPQFSTR